MNIPNSNSIWLDRLQIILLYLLTIITLPSSLPVWTFLVDVIPLWPFTVLRVQLAPATLCVAGLPFVSLFLPALECQENLLDTRYREWEATPRAL